MTTAIIVESAGLRKEGMPEEAPFDAGNLRIGTEKTKDGFILTAKAVRDFRGSVTVTVSEDGFSRDRIFIPAVWYRGNMEGEGCFPTARRAPCWSFCETRMPIPGIIAAECGGSWLYAWMNECPDRRHLASAGWSDRGLAFRFPPVELPCSYRGRKTLARTYAPYPELELKAGESISRRFFFSRREGSDPYSSYRDLIKAFFSYPVTLRKGWEKYAESKLQRLLDMLVRTDDGNAALALDEGNGSGFTSSSFPMESLEAASAFLRTRSDWLFSPALSESRLKAAEKLGINDDSNLLNAIAIRIAKYFLASETAPGFYQDCVDLKTGERGGYPRMSGHPEWARLMNAGGAGEAMSAYMDIYRRTDYVSFLQLPWRVGSFFYDHQLPDGSFGRWWDKDGTAVDSSGTNGAYMGTAMIRILTSIMERTDRREMGDSIRKARDFYSSIALSGDFHGDMHDDESAGKEAGMSILSFLLECIENGFGDERTEKAAEAAASFILTWIWEKDSFIPPQSPLGRLSFHTAGMTGVSVAHHYLDFHGMVIAWLYLRLWRITGDGLWKNEAKKLMNACLSLIADKDNGYLGQSCSCGGWQPEQIDHTSWDRDSDEERMNGSFGMDTGWVSVLGYSSFLHIKEDFPEIL